MDPESEQDKVYSCLPDHLAVYDNPEVTSRDHWPASRSDFSHSVAVCTLTVANCTEKVQTRARTVVISGCARFNMSVVGYVNSLLGTTDDKTRSSLSLPKPWPLEMPERCLDIDDG